MQGRFVSEINVTPFVDVMLVMLIIFMVATPMMSQGLDVDLPQTKQVEVLPTESDHMVLTIRRDGAIFLDEFKVDTLDQLEGNLKSLVKDKNKTLFLQADKEVPYGLVVDVMGRIKYVGIEKLGVIAENTDPDMAAAAAKAAGSPSLTTHPRRNRSKSYHASGIIRTFSLPAHRHHPDHLAVAGKQAARLP